MLTTSQRSHQSSGSGSALHRGTHDIVQIPHHRQVLLYSYVSIFPTPICLRIRAFSRISSPYMKSPHIPLRFGARKAVHCASKECKGGRTSGSIKDMDGMPSVSWWRPTRGTSEGMIASRVRHKTRPVQGGATHGKCDDEDRIPRWHALVASANESWAIRGV